MVALVGLDILLVKLVDLRGLLLVAGLLELIVRLG